MVGLIRYGMCTISCPVIMVWTQAHRSILLGQRKPYAAKILHASCLHSGDWSSGYEENAEVCRELRKRSMEYATNAA